MIFRMSLDGVYLSVFLTITYLCQHVEEAHQERRELMKAMRLLQQEKEQLQEEQKRLAREREQERETCCLLRTHNQVRERDSRKQMKFVNALI